MTWRPARFCALAYALALAACGGGSSSGGTSMTPPVQADPVQQSPGSQGLGKQALYVASASPYFLSAYSLPLHDGEKPALTETGVNEPVPIAHDSSDLYVGSFDDGTVSTYALPLSTASPDTAPAASVSGARFLAPFSSMRAAEPQTTMSSGGIASRLADLSGLAVSGGYLYVAGAGAGGHEVLEYRLPLVAGEAPSSTLSGFSVVDFLGIAARNGTLYVASTTAGTVAAYRLPLQANASPLFTVATTPETDGATGVDVDDSGAHLYVSLYAAGEVEEYSLPYRGGESARTLDVRSGAGGLPYGIAVGEDHLFVTAGGNSILSYRLPFASRMTPDARLPFSGFAGGVSAGE